MTKQAFRKPRPITTKETFLNRYTAIFVFAFALVGGFLLFRTFAASIYYVSPAGNDSNTCTQASPCASINRAYQIASPGDTVLLVGGSYDAQTINWRSSMDNLSPGCDPYGTWGSVNTSNCIKVTPVAGADVKIRGMVNYASGIWFKGEVGNASPSPAGSPQNFKNRTYNFHVSNEDLIGNPPPGAASTGCNCKSANFRVARPQDTDNISMRPDHVIADGIDSDTGAVYAADNVLMRNMDIGPMWYDTPNPGSASGSGPDVPRIWGAGTVGAAANVVWDGNYVHEMNRTYDCQVNNACHNDGLYIVGGGPYIIRNSAFSQIAAENLFFEYFGGTYDNVHDVLIENNWFGCLVSDYADNPSTSRNTCGASKSISFKNCAGTCENILVRYNSWYTSPNNNETSASFSNVRFVGNAGAGPKSTDKICTQATWIYNAFTSGGCGSNNVTVPGGLSGLFKNPAPGFEDFHLLNSSVAANNLVSLTSSDSNLGVDFDSQARTSPRDAGADEFGGAVAPPPPPPTPTASLSASPTSITSGSSSTLSWSSTNTSSCSASGAWSGSKPTSGTQQVSPTSTSTYTLTCSGTSGSASDSASVTVTTPQTKPGDINGDGAVNITDLSQLLFYWGTNNSSADINKDGTVDILDFSLLLSNFGS